MGYTVQREALEPAFNEEWRALLPSASMNKVFASPTWMRVWWREVLAGGAPLMRDGDRLCFAGDTQVCDYMDIIAAPGEEEAVLSAVVRSVGEEPWQELALWAVPEGSPTLNALRAAALEFGLRVDIEPEGVCPQLGRPSTWEEYLAGLNRKDRHELRRKLRKLSQGGEVSLESVVG